MTRSQDGQIAVGVLMSAVDRTVLAASIFAVSLTVIAMRSSQLLLNDAIQTMPIRTAMLFVNNDAQLMQNFALTMAFAHGGIALLYALVWGNRERLGTVGEIVRLAIACSLTVFYVPSLVARWLFDLPFDSWPTYGDLSRHALGVASVQDAGMVGLSTRLGRPLARGRSDDRRHPRLSVGVAAGEGQGPYAPSQRLGGRNEKSAPPSTFQMPTAI